MKREGEVAIVVTDIEGYSGGDLLGVFSCKGGVCVAVGWGERRPCGRDRHPNATTTYNNPLNTPPTPPTTDPLLPNQQRS